MNRGRKRGRIQGPRVTQGSTFSLTRMLHPVKRAHFVQHYWEKQPLRIRRSDPDYYSDLLTLADVDRILSATGIRPPQIRIVRDGQAISSGKASTAPFLRSNALELEELYSAYRDGATVVLQFLHERWLALARLCESLAHEFSASFQVNAYLTPAHEKGLAPHYDTHDVFVMQVSGVKHWRVYAAPVFLPLKSQPYESKTMQPGKLLMEFDLDEGDLLYLPRGFAHDAVSGDSASLHLTVGVNSVTWASVLMAAIESATTADGCLRCSLPIGFANSKRARENISRQLNALLGALAKRIDVSAVIEDAAIAAQCSRRPFLDDHLLDLERLAEVNRRTRVRVRLTIKPEVTTTSKILSLIFHGKRVQLPAHTKCDVEFILRGHEFTPDDLPGCLDQSGRITLIRTLIREGLVTICRTRGRLFPTNDDRIGNRSRLPELR